MDCTRSTPPPRSPPPRSHQRALAGRPHGRGASPVGALSPPAGTDLPDSGRVAVCVVRRCTFALSRVGGGIPRTAPWSPPALIATGVTRWFYPPRGLFLIIWPTRV